MQKNWIPWRGVMMGLAALAAGAVRTWAAEAFTVVALPDTQKYSEKFPGTFLSQTAWIAAERAEQSLVFVTQLGDLVEHFGEQTEWERADRAMRVLDGVIPYSACIGNHDMKSTNCETLFGPSRYAGKPGYLGASPDGRNHARLFDAGNYRILHINFVYSPNEAAIQWAKGMVAAHPENPVIVSTHSYLDLSGRSATGEALWSSFVSVTPQVFLVLCGHVHGELRQMSTNAAGGRVLELLADYQANPSGGEGYLRLLRFDVPKKRLEVTTYSPLLDRDMTGESSHFCYDMEYGQTIRVIGPSEQAPEAAALPHARFRQGVNGYVAAMDLELREAEPAVAQEGKPTLSVDRDEPSGSGKSTQVLLRFGDLFGDGPGKIPPGAEIVSARLRLRVVNDGSGFTVHRMAVDWDGAATWSRFVGGVAADDAESVAKPDGAAGQNSNASNIPAGELLLDVTGSVRSWQAGAPNAGWALRPWPIGSNGVDFAASESADLNQRPELIVEYR